MADTTLVLITREGMGHAEGNLPRRLLGTWLEIVLQNGDLPGAIAFYTDGVKLLVEGSPVLEPLRRLEQAGVRLIACKTCLDHFGLLGQVAVGVVGGMGDILAAQWRAAKVVHL